MDAAAPMILKTEGEVTTYLEELLNIIHIYNVHFLRIGHYCKKAEQRKGLGTLSQRNPSLVRVISVNPEALDAVKILHRAYNDRG